MRLLVLVNPNSMSVETRDLGSNNRTDIAINSIMSACLPKRKL
jgi:hypothetical protein